MDLRYYFIVVWYLNCVWNVTQRLFKHIQAPLFQPKIGILWPFFHNDHQLLKVPLWANRHLQTYECPNVRKISYMWLPEKSPFPGSHISRDITFPRKSNFPGSNLSREVTFPGKSPFPGSHNKLNELNGMYGRTRTHIFTIHRPDSS